MLGIRDLTKATSAGRVEGDDTTNEKVDPDSSLLGVMEVTKVTEAASSSRVAEEVETNEEVG